MAKQYLDVYNKKLSTKKTVARQDVKDAKFFGSGGQRNIIRYFMCEGRGHKAADRSSRASTVRYELKRSNCYKRGSTGYDTKNCGNLSPHFQPTRQRPKRQGTSGTSTQTQL